MPLSIEELAAVESDIDAWLDDQLQTNPTVLTVDRGEPGQRRWYVRMVGEEKTVSTVWFTLGQRQLHCECHFMPAPEENEGRLYEYLLRRNRELTGLRFAIGMEDAVFLVAELPARTVTEAEIDRVLGLVLLLFGAVVPPLYAHRLRDAVQELAILTLLS